MKKILTGWNFMRILRLVLGVGLLVQGIVSKDAMPIILGVVFGGMAAANLGCCVTNGCAINSRSTNKNKSIHYEEFDINK